MTASHNPDFHPGSASCYKNRGCRKPQCTEAANADRRRHRQRTGENERTWCNCWCEEGRRMVKLSDIWDGLTVACHRERCIAMNTIARREFQRRKIA